MTLSFVVVAALPILLLGILSVHYFEKKPLETVSELLNVHEEQSCGKTVHGS